eukprot:gnl/MRDRNA2_/MRDRNA2_105589_c0_seq1.p1 gnl/MRDRNA2_/MRDRNA2_105589_c0~~gnl/MRDRNA2_/MRDRNA2_105589_c0_seq1.p1  ORF type:complete len:404 (+),score=57.82 gnl/MRDRNA2_/MRDRNA2_105589_c0_seq1:90-1301(+)
MSVLKRLKVEEASERITWRNPQFADWKLNWSSEDSSGVMSWDVHRLVLVGGTRPAHFFAGAAREGAYDSRSTELSLLLPQECKRCMEQVLDFMYGEPLGEVEAKDVMPLMKIADVLQCSQLQNQLIDFIENTGLSQPGVIERLLQDACTMQMFSIAESLVRLVPMSQLTSLDFDLLEFDSVPLMRAVAQRMAQSKFMQWDHFLGHGEATSDGRVAIALPNAVSERSRKGYWCHATGLGEARVGRHTWRFRIDQLPAAHVDFWNMVFGVVSGARPALQSLQSFGNQLFTSEFDCGAFASLQRPGPWKFCVWKDKKEWDLPTAAHTAAHRPGSSQEVRTGDIIYVCLNLKDGKTSGDIEWRLNDAVISHYQNRLRPGCYRVSTELYKHEYEATSMAVTLLSHTKE